MVFFSVGLSGFIRTHSVRPAAGLSSIREDRARHQDSVFFPTEGLCWWLWEGTMSLTPLQA